LRLDFNAAWHAATALIWPAIGFAALAFLMGGIASLRKARAAAGEVRINLFFFAIDILIVTPIIGVLLALTGALIAQIGSLSFLWADAPKTVTLVAALFLGDFIGYLRHRLEHSAALWPSHAIHHADTAMTWTTLLRFHPLNRVSTALIDSSALALLGFPPWALILNNLARHYYGMFIHMDLPWTYGPFRRVFVSPAMHRWHHVRDANGAGVNFATLFSVFDQAFGTYHVPGPCDAPLGVRDDLGRGALGQLLHPFRVAWRVTVRVFAKTSTAAT